MKRTTGKKTNSKQGDKAANRHRDTHTDRKKKHGRQTDLSRAERREG